MARKQRVPPPSVDITYEPDGKEYKGSYIVERGMIDVRLHEGFGSSKCTQVGSTPPDSLALMLMMELVGEYLERESQRGARSPKP